MRSNSLNIPVNMNHSPAIDKLSLGLKVESPLITGAKVRDFTKMLSYATAPDVDAHPTSGSMLSNLSIECVGHPN
jgi:hypothetical protein